MKIDRIIFVTKATRLTDLIERYMTESAAIFAVEAAGQSMKQYKDEDAAYKAALALIRQQLPGSIPLVTVERKELPNVLFRDNDLVIVCGPDGLFVNVAQYLKNQPVLTVNPDPKTVAGILMLFRPKDVGSLIDGIQADKHKLEALPFIKASVDGEDLWAINDVFIGRNDHVSARYGISFGAKAESQSSSGVIVSTGVGSTGWIKSVATMVSHLNGGEPHALSSLPGATAKQLVFVVREPFESPGTGASVVTGRITPGVPLLLTSEMASGGCLFSDGVVEKAIPWTAGSTITVSVGDRYVQRIVL